MGILSFRRKEETLPTMQEDLTEILCSMLDKREDWHTNEVVAVNIETGAVLWHHCEYKHEDFFVLLPNVGKVGDFTKKQYKQIQEKVQLARHWRALQQLSNPCPQHAKVLDAMKQAESVSGWFKHQIWENEFNSIMRSF